MSYVETVVIGAGPYGLSLAAHLRAQNVPFAIAGLPMESWRANMPKGLLLKSEPFASNLWDPRRAYTLERFFETRGLRFEPIGVPLPLSDFLEYAAWFRANAVPEVQERKLVQLRHASPGFDLTFDDGGSVSARRVVLATGGMLHRWSPPVLETLGRNVVSHSADISDPGAFAGRDVVVIGCGQSAVLLAALLHEAGATVRIAARASDVNWTGVPDRERPVSERVLRPQAGLGAGWKAWVYSEVPRAFYAFPPHLRRRIMANNWGPSGAWWLKDRVIGRVPLLMRHEIRDAREIGGRVQLTFGTPDGRVDTSADHVIAATGYRFDLGRLAFLDPALKRQIRMQDGALVLTPAFESSVPGLHVIGAASAPHFGPVMRFMFGAKHPAAVLTQYLAERSATAAACSENITLPRSAA